MNEEEHEFRMRYPALWKRWRKKHPEKKPKLKKKKKPRPPPTNHQRAWSAKDERNLLYMWGTLRSSTLATRFGRTAHGINNKARQMGLGPPRQGKITLTAFANLTGYNRSTIKLAAQRLRVSLRKSVRVDPRWHEQTPNTWYALTEEQQEILLEELLAHPDGVRYYALRQGEWIGREPSKCIDCKTTSAPHYAKGLCTRCYDRKRKRRKREKQKGR